MEFGITLAPFDRWANVDELVRAAQAADRLGYGYVALPDHLVVPEGPEQPRSGVVFPDVFTLGAFLAAHTAQVRIVFSALVVPLREPISLAKQAATLDWLSGGRLTIVAGSGWLRSEFEAIGVGFEDRGDRTDEYLRCLKVCWTEQRPSFAGRYVAFQPSALEPKCVQVPHVPLWIGGNGPRPERRVVELGDGWMPLTGTFDERAAAIARIKQRVGQHGRDPDLLSFVGSLDVGEIDEITGRLHRGHHVTERDQADADRRRATSADDAIEQIGRAESAGFTHLGVTLGWHNVTELEEKLEWFSSTVIART
jgi:probable F420-dependent oxidoreductase